MLGNVLFTRPRYYSEAYVKDETVFSLLCDQHFWVACLHPFNMSEFVYFILQCRKQLISDSGRVFKSKVPEQIREDLIQSLILYFHDIFDGC
jgi:hypothetical protein